MTPSNSPSNTPEFTSEPSTITCAGGCHHKRPGLFRAVVYAPFVLVVGTLVAMATFPGLAEYATPLIGESPRGCSYSSGSASSQISKDDSLTTDANPCGSSLDDLFNCCLQTNAATLVAGESTRGVTETAMEDSPVDALSAENVVETQ